MALELSGRLFNGPGHGVTSDLFGISTGETVSDRIEFDGFEGEKYRVAIATKEPLFASRFFKQDIRMNGGEPQPIWININSFKKRFSSGVKNAAYLKAIGHLMKVLPEHLIPELRSEFAVARIALIRQSILKHSPLSQVKLEAIVDCCLIADKKAKGLSEEIVKIGAKDRGLARSILIGPTGKFLLLTHSRAEEKDRVIGEGSYKKVKFAVNLDTAEIKAVGIAKESNLQEDMSWQEERETVSSELQMMEICGKNEDVVHLDFGYHLDPLVETATEEKYYVLMDYCEGGDLFQRIHCNGFPLDRSKQHLWILEMARGLAKMHRQGILHRDLKPHNIFLQKDPAKINDGKPAKIDDDIHAKIGDLGFACTIEEAKEKRNAGSPSYAAPEVILHGVKMSITSEAWSFGCIVFELLTGEPLIPQSVATIKELKKYLSFFHQKAIDHWIDASIPFEYRELLKGLLTLDPAQRLTVEDFYEKFSELSVPR